ncbi:MAG TPA: response regulator [Candidatus Angelobacter sp.]
MPGKAVILCVDDEPNSLVLRKLVLQKAGYEVVAAHSPAMALEILASGGIDLVLSDQLMPGKTGTELTKEIKSQWPALPVILISGVNEIPEDANLADLFMSKVEGPMIMCKNINDVLEKHRSL